MSRRAYRQPRARRDIIEQAIYIGLSNPKAAERFQDAVAQAEQMLAEMPGMGAPRDYGRIEGLRMLRVRGFARHLIFYREIPDGIEIIRVLHSSRDLAAALDEAPGQ